MNTNQKNKQQHINDLEAHLDPGMDSWLELSAWEKLPTEQAFADWIDTDFAPTWEEAGNDPYFKDATYKKLEETCERLDKAMAADSSLVQAVRA